MLARIVTTRKPSISPVCGGNAVSYARFPGDPPGESLRKRQPMIPCDDPLAVSKFYGVYWIFVEGDLLGGRVLSDRRTE